MVWGLKYVHSALSGWLGQAMVFVGVFICLFVVRLASRKQMVGWILLYRLLNLHMQREQRGHYLEIGRNLVTLKSLQTPHPSSPWSQNLQSSFIITPKFKKWGWDCILMLVSHQLLAISAETWSQVRSVLQLRLPLEGSLVTKVATIPTTPEWRCFVLERPLSLHGCCTLACYVYVSG